MPRERIISRYLLMLVFCSILVVLYTGCSDAKEISCKTYEMKPDDVRLEYLNHPLFTLEYPDVFRLIDMNYIPGPFTYDISDVDFTVKLLDLPEPMLSIRIQKPGFADYNDASDRFEDLVNGAKATADNVITKKVDVFGIQADYMNYENLKVLGHFGYPEHKVSFRVVVFNYSGLIWIISMSWRYFDSEPPELQEYFDHVIETFRILE